MISPPQINFRKVVLLIVFFQLANIVVCQDLHLSYGPDLKYTKHNGFYNKLLGEEDNLLYLELKSENKNKLKTHRVVALDKNSNEEIFSLDLLKKKEQFYKKQFKTKTLNQIQLLNGQLILMYSEQLKSNKKYFIEVFSKELKLIVPLVEVFDQEVFKADVLMFEKATINSTFSPITILPFKKGVIFSCLKNDTEKQTLSYCYNLYSLDFDLIKTSAIELQVPETELENVAFNIEKISCDNNGNVFIEERLKLINQQNRFADTLKAQEFYITTINPYLSESKFFEIKEKDKQFYNLKIEVNKEKVYLFGFFKSTFVSDTSQIKAGIFSQEINSEKMDLLTPKFTYFTENQLARIAKQDRPSDLYNFSNYGYTNSSNFAIEKVQFDEKGNPILFCTKTRNLSIEVTTRDNFGYYTYTDHFFCDKYDILVFKLNEEFDFEWTSLIKRFTVFSGWDVKDIQVISDSSNFFVSYIGEQSFKQRRYSNMFFDRIVVAKIDKERGSVVVTKQEINQENPSKKEQKICFVSDIQALNNQFYFVSSKFMLRPGAYVSSIFPPILVALQVSKKAQIEHFYIGRIDLK